MPMLQYHRNALKMRFTCVLHENTLFLLKKSVVQKLTLYPKKTALFAIFLCDFDANIATSSEFANDAFYMCIT